ncbi:MAG: LysM repeat protein, partial [Pseudoalteromonas tetraodonis]
MFGKTETRLSARVTSEDDWQTDVPNIRLSRAFVIVILMHLVAGGALIAFSLNSNDAKALAGESKVEQKNAAITTVAKTEEKAEAKPFSTNTLKEDDRLDDMRRHIVHSGDSVAKIAMQYGVSSEEIHAVNPIDELYQLYQGRVLRIPVSASHPVDLNRRMADAPKTNTNGSNFVNVEQSRTLPAVSRNDTAAAIETIETIE